MAPKQQSLIRATGAPVAPISDNAAALFYRRLFEIDPELAPVRAHEHDPARPDAHADARVGREARR